MLPKLCWNLANFVSTSLIVLWKLKVEIETLCSQVALFLLTTFKVSNLFLLKVATTIISASINLRSVVSLTWKALWNHKGIHNIIYESSKLFLNICSCLSAIRELQTFANKHGLVQFPLVVAGKKRQFPSLEKYCRGFSKSTLLKKQDYFKQLWRSM